MGVSEGCKDWVSYRALQPVERTFIDGRKEGELYGWRVSPEEAKDMRKY